MGKRKHRGAAIVPGTTCFVCDRVLTPTNDTMEHVIPRWILGRYGLWATTYTLAAGTQSYRYDRLKVGACNGYNARLGRALEEPMRAAVVDGAELDLDVARLWLAKLNCGFDAVDAANSEARSRLGEQVWSTNERENREFFRIERLLLEHVGAESFTIRPSAWSSVFVYETQVEPSEPRANFDYADDPTSGFVAVRVGPVGMIGFILDGGFIADGVEFFERVRVCQPAQPNAVAGGRRQGLRVGSTAAGERSRGGIRDRHRTPLVRPRYHCSESRRGGSATRGRHQPAHVFMGGERGGSLDTRWRDPHVPV